MNGQNALIVSIGVLIGFVAGLVASKMAAGSNQNEKVLEDYPEVEKFISTIVVELCFGISV